MQSFLLSVGEKFVPILKESNFRETGRLTPEEFIAAGDYLVFKCPTWSWSSGEESKARSFLPRDKQFLITRNVPAIPPETLSLLHESSDKNDALDYFQSVNVEISQIIQEISPISPEAIGGTADLEFEDMDDIPDIEDFDNQNLLLTEDPASHVNVREAEDDKVLSFINTQTYDLYITYDKFYQTPRMWISGYDIIGKQLSPEKVLTLLSQDHAHKTVTVEAFPHLSTNWTSVHPCKHSAVMKKIIDQYSSVEKEIRVDQYLVIFLKFMSSIMPSVDYDHTMTME